MIWPRHLSWGWWVGPRAYEKGTIIDWAHHEKVGAVRAVICLVSKGNIVGLDTAWISWLATCSYLKGYSFILQDTETLFHTASQGKGSFASKWKGWGLFTSLEACCWPWLLAHNESNRIQRTGGITHMCLPSTRVFGFSSVALGLVVDAHHSTTQEVEAEGWGDFKKRRSKKKRKEMRIRSFSAILWFQVQLKMQETLIQKRTKKADCHQAKPEKVSLILRIHWWKERIDPPKLSSYIDMYTMIHACPHTCTHQFNKETNNVNKNTVPF